MAAPLNKPETQLLRAIHDVCGGKLKTIILDVSHWGSHAATEETRALAAKFPDVGKFRDDLGQLHECKYVSRVYRADAMGIDTCHVEYLEAGRGYLHDQGDKVKRFSSWARRNPVLAVIISVIAVVGVIGSAVTALWRFWEWIAALCSD